MMEPQTRPPDSRMAGERVFIGVGSNIGDGVAACTESIRRTLGDSRAELIGVSSFYTTSPVSPVSQADFTNGAVAATWTGSPQELLQFLNHIETDMGRVRSIPLGPRVIDLDILLFGDIVLHSPSLTIPHPGLHRRRFALVPCVEIDPSIIHPVYREPLSSFLDSIDPPQEISLLLSADEVLRRIGGLGKAGGALKERV